jgi:hypothetical protein
MTLDGGRMRKLFLRTMMYDKSKPTTLPFLEPESAPTLGLFIIFTP